MFHSALLAADAVCPKNLDALEADVQEEEDECTGCPKKIGPLQGLRIVRTRIMMGFRIVRLVRIGCDGGVSLQHTI